MRLIIVAAAIALVAGQAAADDFPARHLTIIVPFSPGSPTDTVSRALAPGLSSILGQQVVVENVTGAGGTTGVKRAARAAPDGYTMVMASTGTHAGAAALYPDLGYDPVGSFENIGLVGSTPIAIMGRKDLPANSVPELIAYLRANEKSVSLAHAGVGSISHIFCAYFDSLIGVHPVAVPFRGLPESTQALLTGQVDFGCIQAPVAGAYVRAGTLKAFLVTGEQRAAMMASVPTANEVALPKLTLGAWLALQFPKGTPHAIVMKLNAALARVLDDDETRARFAALGIDIAPPEKRTPEWLTRFMHDEIARWQPLLEAEVAHGRQ